MPEKFLMYIKNTPTTAQCGRGQKGPRGKTHGGTDTDMTDEVWKSLLSQIADIRTSVLRRHVFPKKLGSTSQLPAHNSARIPRKPPPGRCARKHREKKHCLHRDHASAFQQTPPPPLNPATTVPLTLKRNKPKAMH